jgi:hypothetical protein
VRSPKKSPPETGGQKQFREEALVDEAQLLFPDSVVFALDRINTVIGAV